ncbi:GumC family protein [Sphingomonas sp. CJ99]
MNVESAPPVSRAAPIAGVDDYLDPAIPGDEGNGFEIDFRSIWLVIRRNLILIVGVVALALAIGLVITMLMTPRYSAQTSLQIEQQAAQVLEGGQGVEPATSFQDVERYLQTQVDVLQSRAMAERVAQSLNLFNNSDRFFQEMAITPPEPNPTISRPDQVRNLIVGSIMDGLTVELPRDSRVVTITFESAGPRIAAQIANAYANEFIKSSLQRKFDSTAYARNFLAQQLAEAKTRLELSERELNAYAREAGLIRTNTTQRGPSETGGGSSGASVTTATLVQLNQAANNATTSRILAEEKWRSVQGIPLLSIPEVLGNASIQGLLQQRATISAELNDELARHREGHPTVLQIKARLAETNVQIENIATGIRQSLRQQYESAREQEQSLASQVDTLKSDTLAEQDRSVRYNILQREADTNRTLYDGLLQRFKEISASAGITASNISIVDAATIPRGTSSPKVFLNLALALLAGLAIAGIVVFVREQLDDAIRGPEDIERKLGLSTLGLIPISQEPSILDELENPRSAVAEAYNSLRVSLLYSTPNGLPPLLHVTSTEPGEGKSTTSFALSRGLARLGKRVVLIDIDLRRPALHNMMATESSPGLTDLLIGNFSLDAVVRPTDQEGLSFIPAGLIPPSPTELLGHPRLQELLTECRKRFDVVVLDGPPVLGLADSPLLAALTRATIFVVEADRGRFGATKTALRRLQNSQTHVIGAVLTKFDPKKTAGGYGHYGYSYYHYGSEKADA